MSGLWFGCYALLCFVGCSSAVLSSAVVSQSRRFFRHLVDGSVVVRWILMRFLYFGVDVVFEMYCF